MPLVEFPASVWRHFYRLASLSFSICRNGVAPFAAQHSYGSSAACPRNCQK